MKVYVINGPNINLLGTREPEIYGYETLDDISKKCVEIGKNNGMDVQFMQSNYEGELVGWIQDAIKNKIDAVVINAAAYTHTSIAIHDAFKKVIKEGRPDVDIEEIATGEYWLASQAKEKGLVDEIMTSDDYLCSKLDEREVIEIKTEVDQNRLEKLIEGGASLFRQWRTARFPGAGEEVEDLSQRFR